MYKYSFIQKNRGLNSPKNMFLIWNSVLKTMPQQIINYIYSNFKRVYSSPYSNSFYSEEGQSWDFTPKNQIRVADHWNFYSQNYSDPFSVPKLHAQTNISVENNTHWTIAKKNSKGTYEVILSLPKKKVVEKIKVATTDLLSYKKPNEILLELQKRKAFSIQKQAQTIRQNKINKKNLWVNFDREYYEKQGRRFVKYIDKNINAILISETKEFITVKVNGKAIEQRFKKSTLKNYKELKQKPRIV